MKEIISEAEVLKRLDIPNFRHITKDKIMNFTSLMSKMDPEVAKEAIKQFPEFAKMSLEALTDYKEILEKSLDGNAKSSDRVFLIYEEIIDTLKTCVTQDDISFEQKKYLIDEMKDIAKMANQKDESNKAFTNRVLLIGASMALISLGVGATLLGGESNFKIPKF